MYIKFFASFLHVEKWLFYPAYNSPLSVYNSPLNFKTIELIQILSQCAVFYLKLLVVKKLSFFNCVVLYDCRQCFIWPSMSHSIMVFFWKRSLKDHHHVFYCIEKFQRHYQHFYRIPQNRSAMSSIFFLTVIQNFDMFLHGYPWVFKIKELKSDIDGAHLILPKRHIGGSAYA